MPDPGTASRKHAWQTDARSEPSPDRWFLASLDLIDVLGHAAKRSPVVCLVDDVQRLDRMTADSLLSAARRLHAEGVAILFAARADDPMSLDTSDLPTVHLEGLSRSEARGLLAGRGRGTVPDHLLQRLLAGTGGNPLALLELPPRLTEAQISGLEPLPVGPRVRDAFLGPVRHLPSDTQTALLVAAADGTGRVATILAAAARLGGGADARDAAERRGLVRIVGSQVSFRHPLIRCAIYENAPPDDRRAVHEALSACLASPADADRRAWHRAAASSDPGDTVAEELRAIALRAFESGGFVAASLAYERAARLAAQPDHRATLLTAAAESAWFGGSLGRARTVVEEAAQAASGSAQAEAEGWLALIELDDGQPAVALERFVQAASIAGRADSDRALHLYGFGCLAAAYAGRTERIPMIAARALEVASGESPVGRFLVAFLEGAAAFFSGSYRLAGSSLRRCLDAATAADAAAKARFWNLLVLAGGAASFLGDDHLAHEIYRRLATRARERGTPSALAEVLPRLALTQVSAGQWPLAEAALTEGLQVAHRSGQDQLVGHVKAVLALLAAHRGDGPACRALGAEARTVAGRLELRHVDHIVDWAELLLALGETRFDDAHAHALRITNRPIALWSAPDRIEAAIGAGDPDTAEAWLTELERWGDEADVAWARRAALRLRALLSKDAVEAERLLVGALGDEGARARPFELARTELALGEHLRRSRRRLEARAHLRTAAERFDVLGATSWAAAARSALRGSGQVARNTPDAPVVLTDQQLQIIDLVKQGLTNRQIAGKLYLSHRTVDFHLRKIFARLGVTSRTQLFRFEHRSVGVGVPRYSVAGDAEEDAGPAS